MRIRIPRQFGAVESVRVRSNPDHEPYFAVATACQRSARLDVVGGRGARRESGARLPLADQLGRRVAHLAERARRLEHRDAGCPTTSSSSRIPPPPAWGRSSVMYQIFPDRFARSAAADERELPEWAIAGGVERRAHPHRPGHPAPVLRRRPRRHRRAPRPPRAARRHDDLPDARSSPRAATTATTRSRSPRSTRCSAATRRSSNS